MGLFGIKKRTLSCNICGYSGDKFIKQNKNIYKCPACAALIDFGFSDEEQNLLSTAQSDLRRQEFDVAEQKFSDIIERFPSNHEAYWGYVCSRYGIKHEEDYNGKILPTCCLDSIVSFKQDKDFLKAISLAPSDVSAWYMEQAEYIERVSNKWIEEARKEAPYDIFICFKDSDKAKGIERTQDSYDASDLHSYLVEKGYRVFFSRVSLQDKTGEKYEPYIFNALQTAKVMIVFGSKVEYIKSTWMKNEWHRFCKRISLGEKRENSIVVAYKNFDINELPSILSSKQCLDYSSNKFYLNLQNYLDKFFNKNQTIVKEPTVLTNEPETIVPLVAGKKKENKIFDEQHIHNYATSEVVKPSCIARGYTIHRCECGDEYKDSFTPLADHIFNLDKIVKPTCTKSGQEIYLCSVCGDKDIKEIKATGHSFGEWVTQEYPECEKEGVKAKQCTNCGDVVKESIPSTGHDFGEWRVSKRPSCLEQGIEVRQCKLCGKSEQREIKAVGHVFTDWTVSKDGMNETRYCTNCGVEETRKHTLSKTELKELDDTFFGGAGFDFIQNNTNTKYKKDGNYIYFGSYPQTDVTSSMCSVLESYVGMKPSNGNNNGWISYKYYISGSNSTDFMWYKDITHTDGEKYRAVYFISYRPDWCTSSSSTNNSYQDDNGYYINSVYWFKFEPIKWRILTSDGKTATILAELILDSQQYDYDGGYSNNYANSTIRAWLNDNFYNTAFNDLQKSIINTITVDNSTRSTNPDNNVTQLNNGENTYACSNTQDKIWLLSEQEVTKSAYGFNTSYYASDSVRQKKNSAYAKCMGVYTNNGNGQWWLRSPDYLDVSGACYVRSGGDTNDRSSVGTTSLGVVPALQISL